MSKNELTELDIEDFQYVTELNKTTYWTNSFTAAKKYESEGRVIQEITLDRDIPQAYHGVAEGVDDNGYMDNHHEVKMTRRMMNDQLINIIEAFVWENSL